METRKTPLYSTHKELGARFVPFAGWEMPVQYAGGVVVEHKAVRERAGLFDVSHMGEAIVEGPDALAAVQNLITNDLNKLEDGRALYTVMCDENGGIVDDLIVYREAEQRYFLCINAGRRDADIQHMQTVLKPFNCTLVDCSDDYAQLALQGPLASDILERLTDYDVESMQPFSWVDCTVAGIENVRVAVTGYTGEQGYELYCAANRGPALWSALMKAGESEGIMSCGLAARDTLRLEMKYPLYGNDIDLDHNPYEAGLGWVVKLEKGPFIGRDALRRIKTAGPVRRWVGFVMIGRGIPRHGYPIAVGGKEVGVVTSGTHSPSLGYPIGVGYVPAAHSSVGSQIEIIIRDKPVLAKVVKTPFLSKGKN